MSFTTRKRKISLIYSLWSINIQITIILDTYFQDNMYSNISLFEKNIHFDNNI